MFSTATLKPTVNSAYLPVYQSTQKEFIIPWAAINELTSIQRHLAFPLIDLVKIQVFLKDNAGQLQVISLVITTMFSVQQSLHSHSLEEQAKRSWHQPEPHCELGAVCPVAEPIELADAPSWLIVAPES